jgi:hypothetical protein
LPPLETVPIPTHLPKPPAAPVLARAEDEFVEDDLSEIGAFGKDYTPSEFFEEELGDLSQDWENSF